MGLLLDERKVKAAAGSCHQFIPAMRNVFPVEVDEPTLEAATVYLYMAIAQEIYSRRFVQSLDEHLQQGLRHLTPDLAREHVAGLSRRVNEMRVMDDPLLQPGTTQSPYEHWVRSVIRTLLESVGVPPSDPELVRMLFGPVDEMVTRVRDHLVGIKNQNQFMFR